MLSGSVTLFLARCCDDKKHWKSPELCVHPCDQETFRYRYVVKYKEGILKSMTTFLVGAITGKKGDKTVRELRSRKLMKGMHQYDIFHHPDDQSWKKSVFLGQLFYIKMLNRELSCDGDLKDLLIRCEQIGFGHPSYSLEDVNLCLSWVQDVITNNPDPLQAIYICSVLGQLVDRGGTWIAATIYRGLGQKTADLILTSLSGCPRMLLLQSTAKCIKAVAEGLFQAGSSTGCLLFITYFCKLLDITYVLQKADKLYSRSYIEKEFDQQVPPLLHSLLTLKDPSNRSRYFSYVISCSPSVPCLWRLYECLFQSSRAVVGDLTDEFSNVYSKFISSRRVKKTDLLQPFYWCQAPDLLKDKLANPFCKTLADQITSEITWSNDKLLSLKLIVLDPSLQSSDHFRHLILNILTNKCKEMVLLLPDLLASKTFCCYWKTCISDHDRDKVCRHWLTTSFQEGGTKPKDKVLSVVEAWELLRLEDAMKTEKGLCEKLDKEVERLVLKTKLMSVMDAVKDAQSRAPVIQQRLNALLRSAIKHASGTDDSRSRYRHMIRLLGFGASNERNMKDLQKVELDR